MIRKGMKILVVDDEPNMRILLSEVLRSQGFDVCVAENGMESLERMGSQEFDLVITDIRMPILDGIEMLKRMKQANRRERIIVMSANWAELGDGREDLPDVMMHFEKPFQLDHLLTAVHAAAVTSDRLAAAL